MLFLAKKTNVFERTANFVSGGNRAELTYGDATVADLVNKDSDGDGVLDWEEPLWGLDPTKKETTPGVPDSTVIAKLKAESGYNFDSTNGTAPAEENLTETDKFSRELFSTTAALSQNGVMDQTTAENISGSLAEKIKNSAPRKIYIATEIKTTSDNSAKSIKKYSDALLANVFNNYKTNTSVMDILKRFIVDENNVDATVLKELDPLIKQTQTMIDQALKITVPDSLTSAHLDLLNGLERVAENISDIRLYESDPILALGGISKYNENTATLESVIKKLADLISQKLSN